jgi:hypothetical protein
MPKVSGIDFSILKSIRESVSVRLPDGEVVNLPLISLRDAGIATTFLQRNDTIAVQYSTIQARLQHKAELLSETKDNEGVTGDNGFDAIDATMDLIKRMYKRAEELARENHELCDEIHKFIAPYLEGTKILEQLKEAIISIHKVWRREFAVPLCMFLESSLKFEITHRITTSIIRQ